MKKSVRNILIIALLVTFGVGLYGLSDAKGNEYPGIIRLHVIANSDTDYDQQLKLKVRDRLLEEMEGKENIEEARLYIRNNLANMENIAKEVIKSEGFDYATKAKLGVTFIPEKSYEDITLPAGRYEALTVSIGSGKGHNWWCVIFPQLCIPEKYSDSERIVIKSKIMEIIRNHQPKESVDSLGNSNGQ